MTGKLVAIGMVTSALIIGAVVYYLQVYAYYYPVSLADAGEIRLTVLATDAPEPILVEDFTGIDADSSPLRFRGCFTTPMSQAMLTETYVTFEGATPLTAPGWFDCFDAGAIGAALETGEAIAFMGERNIEYGIDQVVAIYDDGRGYVWHQLNHCGETQYDGSPADPTCPPQE